MEGKRRKKKILFKQLSDFIGPGKKPSSRPKRTKGNKGEILDHSRGISRGPISSFSDLISQYYLPENSIRGGTGVHHGEQPEELDLLRSNNKHLISLRHEGGICCGKI